MTSIETDLVDIDPATLNSPSRYYVCWIHVKVRVVCTACGDIHSGKDSFTGSTLYTTFAKFENTGVHENMDDQFDGDDPTGYLNKHIIVQPYCLL